MLQLLAVLCGTEPVFCLSNQSAGLTCGSSMNVTASGSSVWNCSQVLPVQSECRTDVWD